MKNVSRRRFMLGALTAGGALLVGWGLTPPRQRLHAAAPLALGGGAVGLNGWIAIAPDGVVSVVVPRSEMGQGVNTALPMLVAEELDVPLAQIRVAQAPLDNIYNNLTYVRDALPFHPDEGSDLQDGARWLLTKLAREAGLMFTGGSSSVRDLWLPMRQAGAAARSMLLQAAANEWQVAPEKCRTEAGFVRHPDGRRLAYGALAAKAAAIDPGPLTLKPSSTFTLLGSAARRRDSRDKVNGSARFGIDARPPGLVYAALRMSPVIGGAVAGFDATKARAIKGVLNVVDFSAALAPLSGASAGVAVIATSWWIARQAAAALEINWIDGANAGLTSSAMFAQFGASLDHEDGHVFYERGDAQANMNVPAASAPSSSASAASTSTSASASAATIVSAEYRAPLLAHATMEPINCTAQVKDGKVSLWVSTQAPGIARTLAAKVAGVAETDVSIQVMLLGGGFGRRLEADMVAQAVAIAGAAGGRPVQMIWSREDDISHDVYRPAALARFRARLEGEGGIAAYHNKSVSGSVAHQFLARNLGLPAVGPDKTVAEGEFDMQYEIAHQRIEHVTVDSAVPLGYWRSVGHSHNAFFKESFIDELAHAAGQGSVAFRRALLSKHPRHLVVLNAVEAAAGEAPPGRAHGVALHQSFGSVVGQVAQVSVEAGRIRVHKVWCVIDCGFAVNPNIIAQQMESAVLFGLSAALGGEITVKDGRVVQSGFHDYPVLRFDQAPEVETLIIDSEEPPEGVGEPGVPPIAPAVANALFALTGQRLRSLPLQLA